MAKKVTRKKSKTSLQRDIANLKKKKQRGLKLRKELLARKRELEEIRALEREVRILKGVGTKRRVAKGLAITGGKTVGKFGWKGLKAVGKFAKNVVEAEAREQARERAKQNKRKKR